MAANSTRPAVTIAQNAVSATSRHTSWSAGLGVISSCDQFPFNVSQMP